MPAISREGVIRRNHVRVLGQGKHVLVLAHGLGCDQDIWRSFVPLVESDFTVVLFDYVGSGKSDITAYDPVRYGSLDGYATDVVEVLGALDLGPVTWVGHSVSAMIGAHAQVRAPELFRDLVLVAASPRYLNDPPYVGGFERQDVDDFLSLMDHNFMGWATAFAGLASKNDAIAKQLTQCFCATDPRTLLQFATITLLSDCRALLPKVSAPCLVLQCEDDAIAPFAVGEHLRDRLPRSEYVVMPVTGHCPHIAAPALLDREIRRFVGS